MDENTTSIPAVENDETLVNEDTTLPFIYTHPKESQNESDSVNIVDITSSVSIQPKSMDKQDNSDIVKVTNTLDIKPTSVVPAATVEVDKDITNESPGSNLSSSVIQSSFSALPVTVSSHPTPTYGIDSSAAVSTVVNTDPVVSPMSTLHSFVSSTSLTLQPLINSSVDATLDVSTPFLFPSTQLLLSNVSSGVHSMDLLSASVSAPVNNFSSVFLATSSMLSSTPLSDSSSPSANATHLLPVATKSIDVDVASSVFPLKPSSQTNTDVIQASVSITASEPPSSVHYSSWMVNVTPSAYPTSTEIAPSPTATPSMPHTIATTTMPHTRSWTDSVYQFVFEGNCTLLMESPTMSQSFRNSVKNNLAEKLAIPTNRVYAGPIKCGSVITNVTVEHTDMTTIDDQIMEIIASGNFSFAINNTDNGKALMFQAAGVKVLISPYIGIQGPSSDSPVQTEPFEDSLLRGFWELSEMERILIIVFSVLGGFLFILAAAYIVHVCCLRGQSKSFDLGDTPDHQVKMEDFTLTKLQRPPTIYDEHGMILTEDLHPGQTKMAIPYMPPGGHTCCHGHVSTFKESPVLLRRANDSALHGSAENLVTHELSQRPKDTGVDNMSFSSDDILGDGEGDGTDIETDDDMSPQHHRRRQKAPDRNEI